MSRFDNLEEAEAWLAACEAAQLAGLDANTVSHGGRTVVYHSPTELQRIVNLAQQTVNELKRKRDGGGRVGVSLAAFW